MGIVTPFHTSSVENGDKLRYHNQSECGYGKEIILSGHKVEGTGTNRILCERCADIAAGR